MNTPMSMKISSLINLESINKLIFECNYKQRVPLDTQKEKGTEQNKKKWCIIIVN